MANINVAGTLVRDPELRTFDSGAVVAKFSVADREYVRPEPGQEKACGQFYEVEIWNDYAKMVSDRIVKGSTVTVCGQAVWREYERKDGTKAKSFQIKNAKVTCLDSKARSEELKQGRSPVDAGELAF